MADTIDNIVSSEVFDQLKSLSDAIGQCDTELRKVIVSANDFGKALSSAASVKDAANCYQNLMDTLNRMNTTQSNYISKINEVRNVTAGISSTLKSTKDAYLSAEGAVEQMGLALNSVAKGAVSQSKDLDEIHKSMKDVKKAFDSGVMGTQAYKEKMSELKIEEAQAKQAMAEQQVQMKQIVAGMNAAEGSYNQIKARITELSNALKQMSDDERRNADVGGIMRAELVQLKEQLKGVSDEMGTTNATKFMTQIRAAKNELMALGQSMKELEGALKTQREKAEEIAEAKGKESSEYKEATEAIKQGEAALKQMQDGYVALRDKAVELMQEQKEVNKQMAALSNPMADINAMRQGVGLLASSFTVLKAAAHAAGIENEAVEKTMAKVYIVQQSLNAINQIAMTLNKNSVLVLKTKSLWTKMQAAYLSTLTKTTTTATAAEAANTAQQKANAAATAGATAATGALATGETVATATTFTLAGAAKALGGAIKSIPIIGWILAIISALIAAIRIIVQLVDLGDEENEKKAELIKLETEHEIQVQNILRDTQKYNEELDRAMKTLQGGAKNVAEYQYSVKKVAETLGLTEEYVRAHKDELNGMIEAQEDYNTKQKLAEEAEKNYNKVLSDQEAIRIEIKNINKLDQKSREDALKKMNEEKKLSLTQYKEINKAMHDAREQGWDELSLQYKIEDILQEKLETSDKYLESLKEQNEEAQEAKNTAEASLQAEKSKQLYIQATADMQKRVGDSEIAMEKAIADAENNATKKKNATLKELEKRYNEAYAEREERYQEMIAGMNRDSEEFHNLEDQRTSEEGHYLQEYYAQQKKIIDDYNKEMAQKAKQRADTESDIRIAQYDYALKAVTKLEDKQRYYSLKLEEEYSKKKRQIMADENTTRKQKAEQVELLEKQKNRDLWEYNKKLLDEQMAYTAKAFKDMRDALSKLDSERLKAVQNQFKQDEKRAADPEAIKRLREHKQKETDMLLEMEQKKNQRIMDENWAARDKEEADFNGSEQDWANLQAKWDAIEEAENLRHQNELTKINEEAEAYRIESLRKELDMRMNAFEQAFANEENELIVEYGFITDDAKYQLEVEQATKRIEMFEKQKDAFLAAGHTEEEYNNQHLQLLAEQAAAEHELMQNRMDALKELGSAFVELGNLIADSTQDEVQQTKIKQALAVAQVLMNQGIAISEAVKTGMASGDYYTAAIRIASAIMTVVTSMASAMNAVKQARASVQEAETYAEGTDYHHGGAAIIGEAGYPELVMSNGKSFVVDAPTFFPNLPVGSKVVPLYTSTVTDLSPVLASMEELKHKETVQVNVGKDVYTYIWNGAGRTRILNKKFMH